MSRASPAGDPIDRDAYAVDHVHRRMLAELQRAYFESAVRSAWRSSAALLIAAARLWVALLAMAMRQQS